MVVAVKVTEVPAQTLVLLVLMLTVLGEALFTVIVILFELAVVLVAHAALVVNIHDTIAPLVKLVVLKVLLFVPALAPLTFHWYTGVEPPLLGVAVKVTDWPVQIVVVDAAMTSAGVTALETDIVIAFEDALAGLEQGDEEVTTQLITSLSSKLLAV